MSLDVVAKAAEQRLTLAPVYVPGVLDKHSEWTSAGELERAIFEFNKSGDRTVRLQHEDGTAIGRVESAFVWPWPTELDVQDGRGILKGKTRFPAGSAFCWIRWSPEGWAAVRRGAIRGVSMGGRAARVRADVDPEAAPALAKRASTGWGQRLVAGQTIRFE